MQIKKRCAKAGCRAIIPVTETYCDKHKRQVSKEYDKRRWLLDERIMAFYHSKEWKETRKLVLIRDHGLCQICLRNGHIKKGNIVHHIVEVRQNFDKRLDMNNLETICQSCHTKLHGEKGTYK